MARPTRFAATGASPRPWARFCVLAAVAACQPAAKRAIPPAEGSAGTAGAAVRPPLPPPLPLPETPAFALYVTAPAEALEAASGWFSASPVADEVARGMLAPLGASPLAADLSPYVDLARPYAVAYVAGQFVLSVPVQPAGAGAVAARLSRLPAEGSFGARVLPGPPAAIGPDAAEATVTDPVRLVYFDAAANTLSFAEDLHGVAAAPGLARAYGRAPVFATIHRDLTGVLQPTALEPVPAERITLTFDPRDHRLQAAVEGLADDAVAVLEPLGAGGLHSLLAGTGLPWGVTGHYRHAEDLVSRIAADLTARARNVNFLLRGTAMDMTRRVNAALRTWNGRLLVGALGRSPHLLLAAGTDDPARSERAVLHLVAGLVENVSLARSLGLTLPSIRLRKDAARAGDTSVHQVTARGVRGLFDPSLHPLLAGGDLKVAVAFPGPHGAMAAAVGPDPAAALAAFLAGATPQADGSPRERRTILAARISTEPPALRRLLQTAAREGRSLLTDLLSLPAREFTYRLLVHRDGRRLSIEWARTSAGLRPVPVQALRHREGPDAPGQRGP